VQPTARDLIQLGSQHLSRILASEAVASGVGVEDQEVDVGGARQRSVHAFEISSEFLGTEAPRAKRRATEDLSVLRAELGKRLSPEVDRADRKLQPREDLLVEPEASPMRSHRAPLQHAMQQPRCVARTAPSAKAKLPHESGFGLPAEGARNQLAGRGRIESRQLERCNREWWATRRANKCVAHFDGTAG